MIKVIACQILLLVLSFFFVIMDQEKNNITNIISAVLFMAGLAPFIRICVKGYRES